MIQYKFFRKICVLWAFLIYLRIFVLLSFIVVILLGLLLRIHLVLNLSPSILHLNCPLIVWCFVVIIWLFRIRLLLNCAKLMLLLINNCILRCIIQYLRSIALLWYDWCSRSPSFIKLKIWSRWVCGIETSIFYLCFRMAWRSSCFYWWLIGLIDHIMLTQAVANTSSCLFCLLLTVIIYRWV